MHMVDILLSYVFSTNPPNITFRDDMDQNIMLMACLNAKGQD